MVTPQYGGLDRFRILAALLVVAIHTSPLASFNETADFLLTRWAGRVAVPFFFMVSGFFLFRHREAHGALGLFLRKTGLLYLAAMVLYLPVGLYAGHFSDGYSPWELLGDIVWNGTFYHLWYLPAALLGGVMAWYFVSKSGWRAALAISCCLYAVALLGDSYYGITAQLPLLQKSYAVLFQIFDYTRNGLLFAPVFFVLGGLLTQREDMPSRIPSALWGGACFLLMGAEALTLRQLGWQRHDSMYLFLIPCMWFFFQWLLQRSTPAQPHLRSAAMVIYIVHPLVLILMRGFARAAGLTWLLVDNSAVCYLAVCAISSAVALTAWLLMQKWRRPLP